MRYICLLYTSIRGNLKHIILGRVNGSAVYQRCPFRKSLDHFLLMFGRKWSRLFRNGHRWYKMCIRDSIAVHMDKRILVTLTLDTALALGKV